jgi:phosphate transport system substrate-binding protein
VLALGLVLRPPAPVADTIRIDGSAGVMPLVAALAREYRALHPSVVVEIGGGLGTKARLQALAEGKIDIAMASHGVIAEELARRGMAAHQIARVAVVFGVNAAVPVTDLTSRQICDIYAGAVTNWRELGGPDLTIAPRTRPASEVDAEVVRGAIGCLAGAPTAATVRVVSRPDAMVTELAATSGAVGMTTMTLVEQSQGRIRAVSLDGVAPAAANVERGTYTLTRPSFLLTRTPPRPAVARFLAFVRSPAGARVIVANGAVAVE